MEIHEYEIGDYLLIVNGKIWGISGNDEFYDIEETSPKPMPMDCKAIVIKVVENKLETIS